MNIVLASCYSTTVPISPMSNDKSTVAGGSTRKRARVDAGQYPSKRQASKDSKHRRDVYFVAMMWSLETMAYYDSDSEDRSFASKLCECAKKYHCHDIDFVPQANLVMWLKHCSRVSAINASQALHEDVLGSDLRLQVEDLVHLIALDQTEPTVVHGSTITMATASECQHLIREWTESLDGRVRLRKETFDLRTLQPLHWNALLLEFNGAGLLGGRRHGWDLTSVTHQVETHSTAQPAPDSKKDSIEHAGNHSCATPIGKPEISSVQMNIEAIVLQDDESKEGQRMIRRALRQKPSHLCETRITDGASDAVVFRDQAPAVDNTSLGLEGFPKSRHLPDAQAVFSAAQLDAERVPHHGKSGPEDTTEIHESDDSSQLPPRQEQRLATLGDEETQDMPDGTAIRVPHLLHPTTFKQDVFDNASAGESVSVSTVELGRMVQSARTLEVRRKQLAELSISLQTQYTGAHDGLTALRSRFRRVSADCAKRTTKVQKLRRQAAEVERQAGEHCKLAEQIQREAESQEEECKRVGLAAADVELRYSIHTQELQGILRTLDVD